MWGTSIWGTFFWGVPPAGVSTLSFAFTMLLGGLLFGIGATVARNRRATKSIVMVVALLLPVWATAQITQLIRFQNGTVADADDVNANFAFIEDRIAALEEQTQEVYFAVRTSATYNWPTNATVQTIDFANSDVWANFGGAWDSNSDTFTAPADGTYSFAGGVNFRSLNANSGLMYVYIDADGRNYGYGGSETPNGSIQGQNVAATMHLDKGDTVFLRAYVNSTLGAEVYGNTATDFAFTWFSGAKVQ